MANITTEQMLGDMRDKISQTFARQNGFYETMGVGTAVNLAGQQDRSNADKFRTSGGTEDIATGTARIESIKGNAIAWNQLIKNGDLSQGTQYWRTLRGSISIEDGFLKCEPASTSSFYVQQSFGTIADHKYIIRCTHKGSDQFTCKVRFGTTDVSTFQVLTEEQDTSLIVIATTTNSENYLRYLPTSTSNLSTLYIKNVQIFDLTLIYGEGNEPATVDLFEDDYKRWFGKALTYEDYDAGSLKPVLMTGYKTVGFNLLDPTTGKAHLVGTYGNTNVAEGLYCYEIVGNYTAITDEDDNAITPVNGFFMVENPQEITVTGADENTCIHMTWSGWRNGESEAFWSELSPIPVTTLTGKLNGEGESVVVFPDGMKSAGDVYDEIKIENGVVKAIKRVGSINLGNATWNYSTNTAYPYFGTSEETHKQFTTNALDAKYNKYVSMLPSDNNKCISFYNANNIRLRDTDYTDATAFKASLEGVVLYFELATPEEYILDDFELPVRFKVDDFGTEEQIGEGVASILTLKYGVNAVDALRRLPQNYISVESMDNFLAQLGVAMNGTWSRTWNENNQEYDFTFVANSDETTPEQETNQEEA